ncbi:HlyD family type I secretion periplasmic adaptor subunit [Sphingomonas sp. AP4-R1]|uniref:HlyD family type I secretion periplasmic adaptor subunit n=1 Tax=Sphingomonas sp. AP4-R1 TaxID=2735134 RepID=UPI0014934666|nr:HlyD family type I secretion periplasmic adaptor subunit [Sphingomonas sp. AP4-R1]QJU57109.1 HlyD family type I secretion periplasmic adaptor subunit [Sphingomonas sp. AP4-R1]
MSADIITLNPLTPIAPSADQDHDLPREARLGWIVVALFFGLFLGFASFIRMDSAAQADGVVKVSGSRRAVQHRDGGVVSALHVREGQRVKAGDILIELAGAEVAANERGLASQVIGLQAQHARLLAERQGQTSFAAPAEFASLTGADRQLADDAMRLQRGEMAARGQALSAQKNVLHQQAAQLSSKITGIDQQIASTKRQSELFNDQLSGMRELATKGFASVNRVRELERAQAQLGGDTANLAASGASTRQQIGETRMQALSMDSQRLQQIADDLQKTESAINETLPRWQAARNQVEATRVRAPASGQVVGLTVFTVGAVITPGQKILEVVPDATPLVIEPMISPTDASDLAVGQTAEVRFPSLHGRGLPVFEGKITRMSADSFVDEKSGARFYTAEVTVPPETLDALKRVDASLSIKPGLPAQIIVPLKKRTLLSYLIEPISQSLWRSGRER